MPRLSGANEVIMRAPQHLHQAPELRRHLVGELQRRLACRHGGLLHLLPVLVGAREEVHLASIGAVEARHDVTVGAKR